MASEGGAKKGVMMGMEAGSQRRPRRKALDARSCTATAHGVVDADELPTPTAVLTDSPSTEWSVQCRDVQGPCSALEPISLLSWFSSSRASSMGSTRVVVLIFLFSYTSRDVLL
jgi:hypothetical protein